MAKTETSRDTRSARQVTKKALPIEKANVHNTNKNADTDFLAAALSPSDPPCLFRIQVALTAAAKFRATITKAANTQKVDFNGGNNLSAAGLYQFDILVHDGDTINFQSDQAQNPVMVLRVQEVAWAVQ